MEVSGLGKIFTDQLLDDESLYHCLGYDKEKHEGIFAIVLSFMIQRLY